MLTEITGDLLKISSGILCHQVNYRGVMGGGIAAAIADQILSESQYAAYVGYCKQAGRTALGTTQLLGGPFLVVANMFCQDEALSQNGNQGITDYDAMRQCFIRVRGFAQTQNLTVYIPHNIGCGIARGDWETVKSIIEEVFSDSAVNAVIVSRG